jgi:hypothetical protein
LPGESADRVGDAAAPENMALMTADASSRAPAAAPVRTAEDDAQ